MSSAPVHPTVSLVAGVARNGVIGHDNDLLWRIPEDLKHFRRVTMGCPVVMGRKTWDSLPERFRPLPGRHNIVITRSTHWQAAGATRASSLEQALELAGPVPKICVIGGAQIYELALPRADELVLTEIDHDFAGDTHFPPWPRNQFTEVSRETHAGDHHHPFAYSFVTYLRKP